MKGYVPVSKEALLSMTAHCKAVIYEEFDEDTKKEISWYISNERKRITTRCWYRLWRLPKARFEFTEHGVKEFSATRQYDLFESDPFKMLRMDRDHSLRWVRKIERLAKSNNSGEPIQLDVNTFMRLDTPENYLWVDSSVYYSIRS